MAYTCRLDVIAVNTSQYVQVKFARVQSASLVGGDLDAAHITEQGWVAREAALGQGTKSLLASYWQVFTLMQTGPICACVYSGSTFDCVCNEKKNKWENIRNFI